jgi:putative SOS response-associated peptidase YedK
MGVASKFYIGPKGMARPHRKAQSAVYTVGLTIRVGRQFEVMCGRTSLFVPPQEIERRFDAEFIDRWTPQYNIAPQEKLATIQNDASKEIDQLEWGLIPHWVDDPGDGPKPINARAESVAEKPYFRDAFSKRRCLVIADGFYEWKGERGHKQPYRVQTVDGDPYAYAGLWESWGTNGDTRETVTIITTEANGVVAPIHDRMPVMLEPDEEDVWLESDDEDELAGLLDPYPNELTEAYPISKKVNDPGYEQPDVIEPVDIGEQSGLGEFG